MSRIGKLPVQIPAGVTITIDKDALTATGPKGTLSVNLLEGVNVKQDGEQIIVERINDESTNRAKHGLIRSLINNAVIGVQHGFSKKLEINGVGFRVALVGKALKFNIGFSHEVVYNIPEGIQASIEQNIITISGASKQQVGQVAAEIRALKKPEPYKGKGIKYIDERIIRKSGKSGKD